jgi:hypothetical protein
MYALWILFRNFKNQTSYGGKLLMRGLLIWVLLYVKYGGRRYREGKPSILRGNESREVLSL